MSYQRKELKNPKPKSNRYRRVGAPRCQLDTAAAQLYDSALLPEATAEQR
jgi:hypothetical protein